MMKISKRYILSSDEFSGYFNIPPIFAKYEVYREKDFDDKEIYLLVEKYNWFTRKVLNVIFFIPNLILQGFSEGFPIALIDSKMFFKNLWADKEGYYNYIRKDTCLSEENRYNILDYWWKTKENKRL